jgi:hypothetical protein
MTITELNAKLTQNLKSYIKTQHHNETGHLYNSIKFKCTFDNNQFQVKFDSYEYILYLEHGEFIQDFFKLDSTLKLLSDFIAINITITTS